MRYLLLHPTHRKFIRLLRDRVNSGYPIIITQSDNDAIKHMCEGAMTMIKRHQGIYRIVLTAVYRPIEEIVKDEKIYYIGYKSINIAEKCFFKAEWRHLGTTLGSGYLVPILRHIIKKLEQRKKRRGERFY